jgi:hypothetical protein
MKTLLTISTLVFSTLMFSTPSYAKWEKVTENTIGDTYYVDFGRIRKHGGYVYFWRLDDYLKPTKTGILSGKTYKQGDCKLFRYKFLSFSFHKEPMGGGTGEVSEPLGKNGNWKYPSPNSVNETILKQVCSR